MKKLNSRGDRCPRPWNAGSLVVWAATFATLAVAGRLAVLGILGSHRLHPSGVSSILSGLPELLVVGAVLGVAVLSARGVAFKALAFTLLFGVLTAHAAAFRYEAVFDRLPSAGVFFYLLDLEELAPSLAYNAVPLLLVAELGGVFLLLLYTRIVVLRWNFSRRQVTSARCVLVTAFLCMVGVHLVPAMQNSAYPWRQQTPLGWLVESALKRGEIDIPEHNIGPQSVLWFQQALGHGTPFGGALSSCPLCGPGERGADSGPPYRSAILLILESVGTEELLGSYQGKPVMPNLAAFARRNLLFKEIKAAGTKSGSAMPAMFCGLPPQTEDHLLHRLPLNTFEGFPGALNRRGYRLVFFHGGDLTWEFQRSFLRMVGVGEIHERDPRDSTPVYGWGYSDGETLGRLQDWIGQSRREKPESPFFAGLFTLSSHDPYEVPPEWPLRFEQVDARSRQYESLAYLDSELGHFLRWYEEEEMSRGTVLAMVGDHTPHLMNTVPTSEGPVFRFDVPLILAGATPAIEEALPDWQMRRGAQYDVPATLMHALGLPSTACDQGSSLLSPDDAWPAERIVYAAGGETKEEIQLWSGDEHILVDRLFRGVQRLDRAGETEITPRMKRFLEILIPLNRFLMTENAYAPPQVLGKGTRPQLPRVDRPIFVSHKGNTEGESAEGENTLESIGAALAAGFDCVEIDVQMSRDGVPVLHHDAFFIDGEGRKRVISGIDWLELSDHEDGPGLASLEQALAAHPTACLVVEMKPQGEYDEKAIFGEAVATLVRAEQGQRRIIVDSFSLVQVAQAEPTCDCEAAWDLPYRRPVTPELLNAALLAEVEWIFVEHSVAKAETIAAAHEAGIRVMLYTVNEVEILERLGDELPDGVITDRAALAREFMPE